MSVRSLALSLVCFGLAAAPALAQVSADGGPIYVNAQSSESLELERKVILTGNVDIQQGASRLRADKVTLQYAARRGATGATTGGGIGQIESMTAEGNVFYVTPEVKAKGDRGVYLLSTDTITLTGKVALLRDQDIAEGEKLTMEVKKRRTSLDGGTGRTRMKITPSNSR